MAIRIQDACRLMHQVTNVPIFGLADREWADLFCKTASFRESQDYFTYHNLKKLIQTIAHDEMLCMMDEYRLRYIFAWAQDVPLVFGPYCSEKLTQENLFRYLPKLSKEQFPVNEFLIFHGRITEISQEQAIHYMTCLLQSLCDEKKVWEIRNFETDQEQEFVKVRVQQSWTETIEARYRTEELFMESVRQGKTVEALEHHAEMLRDVAYLRNNDAIPQSEIQSTTIVATMARIAAVQGGAPVVIVDKITADCIRTVKEAKRAREIVAGEEYLIRELCRAVQNKREGRFSKLVQIMKYYVSHQYQQEITVEQLAAELGVSTVYLRRKCKEELGITPNELIRKTKMEKAAKMLCEQDLSIQEISARVGIQDANYFVKVFRKEYGCSPSEYRKLYKA